MLHAPDWVSPSPSTVVADGEEEGTHGRGPGDGDRGGAVGYRRRSELGEIGARLAPLHPKNNTFPGEVLLELAADAIAGSGPSSSKASAISASPLARRVGYQPGRVRFA
jgi:hypothetical protein